MRSKPLFLYVFPLVLLLGVLAVSASAQQKTGKYSIPPQIDTSKFTLYLRYPVKAYQMGIEGTVLVDVYIDQTGMVYKVNARTGDQPALVRAVKNAVNMLKEEAQSPRQLGGTPVEGLMQIEVRFELSDSASTRYVHYQNGVFVVRPFNWSAHADSVSTALKDPPPDVKPIVDRRSLERALDYPERARLRGVEGTAIVRALVTADGTVDEAYVVMCDSPLFNQAALDAVRAARYDAAERNGEPVSAWLEVPVAFEMTPTP
jgi:TonB family protein